MPDRQDAFDPSAPEHNPLGLGSRGRESANTGSEEDTHYDAVASDPYTTGEPERRFDDLHDGGDLGGAATGPSVPADPDVPSSDEP